MKLLNRFIYLLVFGALVSSCISNKRIVYLQDHSKNNPHEYLADTAFAAAQEDYRIEMGDILYVKSDHPQLSQTLGRIDDNYMNDTRVVQVLPVLSGFTVDSDGFITLPTIGRLHLQGKTIFEAQHLVNEAASKVFPDPAIKVFLLNWFVTVLGEVNKPGRYPVYNHKINVFEAMGLANDATDFASREEVKVIRNRDGVNHLYHLDLTDQNILSHPAFFLEPNDVLLVKPQKRKKYATRDVQNVLNAIALVLSAITVGILATNARR